MVLGSRSDGKMGKDKILWIIVMAKNPIEGKVKTRLIGQLTALQACEIHQALMQCVMSRLPKIFRQIDGHPVRFGLAIDGGPAAWSAQKALF